MIGNGQGWGSWTGSGVGSNRGFSLQGLCQLLQSINNGVQWPACSQLGGGASGESQEGSEGSGVEGSGEEGTGAEGSGAEGSGTEGSGVEGSQAVRAASGQSLQHLCHLLQLISAEIQWPACQASASGSTGVTITEVRALTVASISQLCQQLQAINNGVNWPACQVAAALGK